MWTFFWTWGLVHSLVSITLKDRMGLQLNHSIIKCKERIPLFRFILTIFLGGMVLLQNIPHIQTECEEYFT